MSLWRGISSQWGFNNLIRGVKGKHIAVAVLGTLVLGKVSSSICRCLLNHYQRKLAAHEDSSGDSQVGETQVGDVSSSPDVNDTLDALVEQVSPTIDAVTDASLEMVPETEPELAAQQETMPGREVGEAVVGEAVADTDASSRVMDFRTLFVALLSCDQICQDSIGGPFHISADNELPVVCFHFRMTHFPCKAYCSSQDEGSQLLKFQTIFEDNRRSLGEEQRYFITNDWNATKRYTRLKCSSSSAGRSGIFTLEYDVMVPAELPHVWGLVMMKQTLRMWHTSMLACVMHIVEPRDMPFATHDMITQNTLAVSVREEDTELLKQACPICFETFRVGDEVRRLPCMHIFHLASVDADPAQACHCNVDRHLVFDKKCPVCKTPIDIMEHIGRGVGKNIELVSVPGQTCSSASARSQLPSSQQPPAATPAASVVGEPAAQAAELERAVRSLQSRWVQIQGVVVGMQQMLQHIEESQTVLTTARREVEAGPDDPVTQAPEAAVEVMAAATPGAVQAPTAVAAQAPTAVAEVAADRSTQAVLEAPVADRTRTGLSAVPGPEVQWRPFTQVEKECMAFAWQRRCSSAMNTSQAAPSQPL